MTWHHKQAPSLSINTCSFLSWRLKRFTLWVDVEWPNLPSVLVAKAAACHLPSSLISPWWMTTSRSNSMVLSLKKWMQTRRNTWSPSKTGPVQGAFTATQPLKDILLADTALQLFEVTIHHGKIKPIGGWQDFAMRMLGKLGHSTLTHWQVPTASLQPTTRAFNNSSYSRNFRAAIFGKPLITRFQWRITYFTARDKRALRSPAVNAIRPRKRVVPTTYSNPTSMAVFHFCFAIFFLYNSQGA